MIRVAGKFCSSKIRNFCIIAHIDHGKSTLADRFLEITGVIPRGERSQFLDKLPVEKERGITVKAQTCTMRYRGYTLNLVDTPGHCDFSYEVRRSMRCCSAALLLVDATQGVQAQTLTNYQYAKQEGLMVIPVINKVDMLAAQPEEVAQEIVKDLQILDRPQLVSAKTGQGVELLLDRIIREVPSPLVIPREQLSLFMVSSWYEKNKGVMCLFQVKSGVLKKGLNISSPNVKGKNFQVFEVGVLSPEMEEVAELGPGMVGYAYTNMKQVSEARVGDTFFQTGRPVDPFPGFEASKPVVFAGLYSVDPAMTSELQKNLEKLALRDPAVRITRESSSALGNGFKVGFLGMLHMDIFRQRLEDEFGTEVIVTTPSVPYRCMLRKKGGGMLEFDNAADCPDKGEIQYYEEPMVRAKLIVPHQCSADIVALCQNRRGKYLSRNDQSKKVVIYYRIPLSEIVTNFVGEVKAMTRGYGSMDYDHDGFQRADIQKLTICIMGDPIDALTFLVHSSRAFQLGKKLCKRLKENIPQQLFVVSIQAKVGTRVIAKEDIPHAKKHVTAGLYGGDQSRKRKVIERYMEGKKELRKMGKVQVTKNTFLSILSD